MHVDCVAHRPGQREERTGRDKDGVDRIMRHAVIDDIEEASGLAGRSDLGDDPVCRIGVAAAKARDADIGMDEKSLASAAIDRLRSFSKTIASESSQSATATRSETPPARPKERASSGELGPVHTHAARVYMRSILVAMMKSFSCSPLIFLVCRETVALPHPKLISG